MMKTGFILFAILSLSIELHCQLISGRVSDLKSGEPLEYASIGILNTHYGTITDRNGYFRLEAENQALDSKVRISMIAYKPQLFELKELLGKEYWL